MSATRPREITPKPSITDKSSTFPAELAFVVAAVVPAELVELAVVLALELGIVVWELAAPVAMLVDPMLVLAELILVLADPVIVVSVPPCSEAGAEELATIFAAFM